MGHTVEALGPEEARVRVEGAVTAQTTRPLYDELLGFLERPALRAVQIDFGAVQEFDSPAAAALTLAVGELRRAGKRSELTGLSPRHRLIFDLLPPLPPAAPAAVQPERWGPSESELVAGMARLAEFGADTLTASARVLLRRQRLRRGSIIEQSVRLGVGAVFIVGLLSFLTGLILAFQSAYQLERFGAGIYMAQIVGLGMVREFAPLMTAIILAGRSSSAIAAELGTMAVRHELDALRVIGIDVVSFLVVPRLVAITCVQPALTVLAMVLGIGGGLLVAGALDLPLTAVYWRMQETLTVYDLSLGLFKSVLFAWVVGLTGCFLGLTTRGGASSVGRHTTRAVVSAIFWIIVVDSLVTTLWTMGGYGER